MAVREDCRHYSTRTTGSGEVVQRCRVDMAEAAPFACPEGCLFFEPRSITDAGWSRFGRTDDAPEDDQGQ
ncbi:MAG: hypothetical protein ACOYXM_09735 [Actinomycetota bacterium]